MKHYYFQAGCETFLKNQNRIYIDYDKYNAPYWYCRNNHCQNNHCYWYCRNNHCHSATGAGTARTTTATAAGTARTTTATSTARTTMLLVLLEQPLEPLLTGDRCFFAGPHKSSEYSSDLEWYNINIEAWWDSARASQAPDATAHSTMGQL